jgi:hypothetical protein
MTAAPTTGPGPVTDGETAPAPAVRDDNPATEPGSGDTARLRAYARARLTGAGAVFKPVWAVAVGDVPSVWNEAPASPAELVRYARGGAWCRDTRGFIRGAGRAYHAAIAIPVCLVLYVLALIVQRPGRLTAALFLSLIVWLVL